MLLINLWVDGGQQIVGGFIHSKVLLVWIIACGLSDAQHMLALSSVHKFLQASPAINHQSCTSQDDPGNPFIMYVLCHAKSRASFQRREIRRFLLDMVHSQLVCTTDKCECTSQENLYPFIMPSKGGGMLLIDMLTTQQED